MEKCKFSLLIVLCLSLLFGCAKEEEIVIEADKTNITLSNDSEPVIINVSSNTKWTITNNTDYLTVTPTNGVAGTTAVSITADVNNTPAQRSASLDIVGKGAVETITVTQPSVAFSLSVDILEMSREESSKTFSITSNTSWSINSSNMPSWIKEIKPLSGTGNATITVSVNKNTNREKKNTHILNINYGNTFASMLIEQEVALNNAPTKPSGLTPGNGSVDVSIIPQFTWSASTEADGDSINYSVQLSKNGTEWQKIYAGNVTSMVLPTSVEPLTASTTYYYKVTADDGLNNGKTDSDVVTFTTGAKDAYEDGEYVKYMESKKSNPIVLIFTGDGYIAEDHKIGKAFDKDLNEAIDAFFDIEPYNSYREYFTVYKLAAYSNERGVSNTQAGVTKDTKFKTTWAGSNSTSISTPDDGKSIFDWCKRIPGVTDYSFSKMAIGVVINADAYAGTCWSWSNGQSIAMMTYKRNPSHSLMTFGNVVRHEMGGHGFGRLADEYINYNEAASQSVKDNIELWQGFGNYHNVSVYPTIEQSPWAHFKGLSDYSHVGMFEGGNYYAYGVWRPEEISCMNDNRPYYNSPSRFLIVRRLLEIAGELTPIYNSDSQEVKAAKIKVAMDKFIAKDIKKSPNAVISSAAYSGWGGVPYDFIPLAPPVLIINE